MTAGMPGFSSHLLRDAEYYRIEWLPDGYSGRRDGDRVWAHPIYGAYVLKDYLEQDASAVGGAA